MNYISFIKKVWEELDTKLLQVPNTVACKKGCSACCRCKVSASPIEVFAIVEHLRTLPYPEFKSLKKRLKNYSEGYMCPFLQQDSCMIYSHRTITCRTLFSNTPDKCATDTTSALEDAIALRQNIHQWIASKIPNDTRTVILPKAVLIALNTAVIRDWLIGKPVFEKILF